jgi:hypothetical protein
MGSYKVDLRRVMGNIRLNREVSYGDCFLVKIEQANICDFDVQFQKVICDSFQDASRRKDK